MSDKKEQDSSIQSIERRGLLKMLPAAALIPSVAKMFPTSTLDASQERPASEGDDVSATQLFAARKSIDFRAILTPYSIPIGEASGDHFFSNHVFSDKEYWTDRLSVIAKDGYNAVVWMGPSELFAFWPDGGGGHLLLRHKEFPEAREISADKNEEIIAQMKWLFRTVKDLGMMNFLHTHVIWYTKAFGRAHGLDHPMPVSSILIYFHNEGYGPPGKAQSFTNCGVRNEITRAYTESVFAEFPQVYEDLDGFFGDLGEALPGDKGTYFKEAIAPGLRRCGRKPIFIAMQWQTPMKTYLENVAPKQIYDRTWVGYHSYNSEQVTDAKPYPGVTQWAEKAGLPFVVDLYPANMTLFPFNSPRFAYQITREMRKIDNFQGFIYFEFSKISALFREALAYYGKNAEDYSEDRWLNILTEQFGDRDAAQHMLRAYDISARIIPETCALVYSGSDNLRREFRLPYTFLNGSYEFGTMTSPARGQSLVPVPLYARFVAKDPKRYKDNNGDDPTRAPYSTGVIWDSEGGSVFDVIPPVHMEKIRMMGEECRREAEDALKTVKKDEGGAKETYLFMRGYQLLSSYYEQKVAAATAALIYSHSHRPEDKAEAERLADAAVSSYVESAGFMQENLDPTVKRIYGRVITEAYSGPRLSDLIVEEKQEREKLPQLFGWAQQ
jgi:hypothetical protein